jgi:hypothetical protein
MKKFVLVVTASLGVTSVALAAGAVQQVPLLTALFNCAGESSGNARLACYDQTVPALKLAIERKEIVIVDSRAVGEAKRSLFGISLPKLRIFGDGSGSAPNETLRSIEAKIVAVGQTAEGGVLLSLDAGSRWAQVGSDYVNRAKAGETIIIRRGDVGGYMAKIGTGRAFRVRRLPD